MATDKVHIEHQIFSFIEDKSNAEINRITSQTLLFREGIFDSMSLMLLVDFLEEKIGIRVGNDDLVERNFESVSAITDFVVRKKSA